MQVIDETGKKRVAERKAETVKKDLQGAQAQAVVANYNARQQRRGSRDGGGNRPTREQKEARETVGRLQQELKTVNTVGSDSRADLAMRGAFSGMGASYAGAGGTALKALDMAWRAGTDEDILSKRGEVTARRQELRQSGRGSRNGGGNRRTSDAKLQKREQELQELTAAKEAEALDLQLGLMKAASALDDGYERLAHRSATDIERAKRGASAAGRFAINAAVTGTQIAADGAANALLPGAGIALKGVRAFGDASQEARREGASVREQVEYGTTVSGLRMGTEKLIDGLGGAYGKGVDSKVEQFISKHTPINQKATSRLVDVVGEAAKPLVNYGLETPLKSVYNDSNPFDNYSTDAFSDALRDAAVQGMASGIINAWSDTQNQVLDRVYDMAGSPQTQAALRKSYVGSPVQENAESYAALIQALYNAKGDGHRW